MPAYKGIYIVKMIKACFMPRRGKKSDATQKKQQQQQQKQLKTKNIEKL